MGDTYEFILRSVLHGNTFSFKSVDTSGGDDREGHGVVGEVGSSSHAREGFADEPIGFEILVVCGKKLVGKQSTVYVDQSGLESCLGFVYDILDLALC